MNSDWQKIKLDDVVERINTGLDAIRRAPIVSYPTQIKCLRIQDISQNKSISEWGFTKVKDSDYENYRLRKGEIIMARTCSTGINYLVKDDLNAVFNNGLARLRVKKSRINEKFLFYIFRSSSFINYINGISCGTSVQLNMKVGDLSNYEFLLPSIFEQNKIANILGSLDEKIELIKKKNETFEEIAKALFKSWFIDFDPVRAKSEGRSTGLPNEISDLFPDSFEYSELGMIPKNWLVSSIDELNEITMGQSPPGSTYNESGEGLPFYQGKTDFGFRHPTRRIFCSEPQRLAEQSSTLLSVRAPVGSINLANESCCIGRGVASIKSKQGHHSFTYYLLNGIQSLFDIYNSEGTVFGAINKNDLSSIRVVKSPSNIRELFDEVAMQIDYKISLGIQEINLLTSLRDTLLPKLISGKIRIPDAEKND